MNTIDFLARLEMEFREPLKLYQHTVKIETREFGELLHIIVNDPRCTERDATEQSVHLLYPMDRIGLEDMETDDDFSKDCIHDLAMDFLWDLRQWNVKIYTDGLHECH